MPSGRTSGVDDPDRPGHRLVPPWPVNANFGAVVRHFIRFTPYPGSSYRQLIAYFLAYQAALDAAPDERTEPHYLSWCAEMRECIAWCVTSCQEKQEKQESAG